MNISYASKISISKIESQIVKIFYNYKYQLAEISVFDFR